MKGKAAALTAIAALALLSVNAAIGQEWLTDPQVTGPLRDYSGGYSTGLCYKTDTYGYITFYEHYNNHLYVATYNPYTKIIHFDSVWLKNQYEDIIKRFLRARYAGTVRDLRGYGSWGKVASEFLNR